MIIFTKIDKFPYDGLVTSIIWLSDVGGTLLKKRKEAQLP